MMKTEELVKSGALKNLTWTKGNGRRYEPLYVGEYEGKRVTISCTGFVSYKKEGRLRVESGTRYVYKLEISVADQMPFEFNPGAVLGEGSDSRDRTNKKKQKISNFAKKYLGVEIGEYDYSF